MVVLFFMAMTLNDFAPDWQELTAKKNPWISRWMGRVESKETLNIIQEKVAVSCEWALSTWR